MATVNEILNQMFGTDKSLNIEEIPTKQKNCYFCKQHKKFTVMNGYFQCHIEENKLKFELGEFSDPYEVEPFEIPLGFCFACGSRLTDKEHEDD